MTTGFVFLPLTTYRRLSSDLERKTANFSNPQSEIKPELEIKTNSKDDQEPDDHDHFKNNKEMENVDNGPKNEGNNFNNFDLKQYKKRKFMALLKAVDSNEELKKFENLKDLVHQATGLSRKR